MLRPGVRLVVALLVAGLGVGVASTQPAAASVTSKKMLSFVEPCQDVVFLGARGSGQPATEGAGLGSQVYGALLEYQARVTGRRVAFFPLDYPARSVSSLLEPYGLVLNEYFAGMDEGVAEALSVLKYRAHMCPRERYVLAGYSQGAMVVHRVLSRLSLIGVAPGRLDGAILIADGDRQAVRSEVSLGNHLGAYGITWFMLGASQPLTKYDAYTSKLPSTISFKTFSLCDYGDLVCDTGLAVSGGLGGLRNGLAVHSTHYKRTANVVSAASKIAARTMAYSPVPPMSVGPATLPAGRVGDAYHADLKATGGVAPYRMSLVKGTLPPGVALSGASLVGVPTTAGSSAFTLQVRDSLNQVITRAFAVTVSPPAAPPGTALTVGTLTLTYPSPQWAEVMYGASGPGLDSMAKDSTNQAPCTDCGVSPVPMVPAFIQVFAMQGACPASSPACLDPAQVVGDAPSVTVGGRTPDFGARFLDGQHGGTGLVWCFVGADLCIFYRRGVDYPQLESSPALLDLLSSGTWSAP